MFFFFDWRARRHREALDPYFPFERAVEAWGRSFAALGIRYRGATMTLDLLDRPGKYSNGFCHWPQPAWRRADGAWTPSAANFTSLAEPAALGSGVTALTTLMHEVGGGALMHEIGGGARERDDDDNMRRDCRGGVRIDRLPLRNEPSPTRTPRDDAHTHARRAMPRTSRTLCSRRRSSRRSARRRASRMPRTR